LRLALWEQLSRLSATSSLWALIGCAALIAGGLRMLAVLAGGDVEEAQNTAEKPGLQAIFVVLILAVFAVGLFPR
jgi:uncharacterized membrane protein